MTRPPVDQMLLSQYVALNAFDRVPAVLLLSLWHVFHVVSS